MVILLIVLIVGVSFLFSYSMVVTGKAADQRLKIMEENSSMANGRILLEDKMESQREITRKIENEIKKGSAPLHFEKREFQNQYILILEFSFRYFPGEIPVVCWKVSEK